MKLVVGLGNPGKEYLNSRHNVGFMVAEELAGRLGLGSFTLQKKFKAEVIGSNSLLVAKPQTMMNGSGEALAAIINFYKIDLAGVYVVHDDLDIHLGKFKLQFGRGPKIHRGLQSVYKHIGSKEIWHVRIGTDNRVINVDDKVRGEEYVLSKFLKDEKAKIEQVIKEVVRLLLVRVGEAEA